MICKRNQIIKDLILILFPLIIVSAISFFLIHNSEATDIVKKLSLLLDKRTYVVILFLLLLSSIKVFLDKSRENYFKSMFYIFLMGISGVVVVNFVKALFISTSAERALIATELLIRFENIILPENLIFKIHSLNIPTYIEKLISWSYLNLTLVFVITFILVFLFNNVDYRKLTLSIIIAPILLFPFWFIFPATSPEGFYNKNIFNLEFSDNTKNLISTHQHSKIIRGDINELNQTWISPTNQFINVTSIPSLHVLFGYILMFYALRIKKILAIFYIPWFILNFIGTFYLFQHFILDAISGLIIGILLIYLVEKKLT